MKRKPRQYRPRRRFNSDTRFTGYLKGGEKVICDLEKTKTDPDLKPFIKMVLQKMRIPSSLKERLKKMISGGKTSGKLILKKTVEFTNTIGLSRCVETGPKDLIVWAQRQGRERYDRFVKGREPVESTKLSLIVLVQNNGTCRLISAHAGGEVPPNPQDYKALQGNPRLLQKSLKFWSKHALVYDPDEIDLRTETTENPWKERL